MAEFIKDLWCFMRLRKKRWLAPIAVLIALIAALLFFTEGSVVAPLIYALF